MEEIYTAEFENLWLVQGERWTGNDPENGKKFIEYKNKWMILSDYLKTRFEE